MLPKQRFSKLFSKNFSEIPEVSTALSYASKRIKLFFIGTLVFASITNASSNDLPGKVSIESKEIQTQNQTENKAAKPIKHGMLLILVFRNGLPIANAEIFVNGERKLTDPYGAISMQTKVGTAEIKTPEIENPVNATILEDLETEVTLNLLDVGPDKRKVIAPQVLTPETPLVLTNPKESKKESSSRLTATLTIRVISETTKRPVPNASILTSLAGEKTWNTDALGQVTVKLPADQSLTFTVFSPNLKSETIREIRLKENEERQIELQLKDNTNSLEEVIVLAPKIKGGVAALIEVRRSSSGVVDTLAAEQMAKSGDSDAAGSLRRVTGLTLIDGKYIFIRGLGDRYSGVTLNSFGVPSPEPSRRVVPLDLFPASLLESVSVQKSYSSNIAGEFGGGQIQLKTKSLPDGFFFKGSLSTTVNNEENSLQAKGGSKDWLGIDDGSRALSPELKKALASGQKIQKKLQGSNESGFSEEELQKLGQSFPTNYNTKLSPGKGARPNVSLATGNRWQFGDVQFGLSGSGIYGQETDFVEKTSKSFNVGANDTLTQDSSKVTTGSSTETKLVGALDSGVEIYKQKFLINSMLIRNTSLLVQKDVKKNVNEKNTTMESDLIDWTERQLWTKHLRGYHPIPLTPLSENSPLIEWKLGESNAIRDNPDRRETSFTTTEGIRQMRPDSAGNRRTFSYLTDDTREAGAQVTVPVMLFERKWATIETGFSMLEKTRKSDVYRFFFNSENPNNDGIDRSKSADEILSKENIGPGKLVLQNLTDAADSYTGEQKVNAFYLKNEVYPVDALTLSLASRWESSEQTVKTFKYYEPLTPFSKSSLVMKDTLPAYSVLWKIRKDLQTRLAYSETVARPEFRELSPVGFIDDETGVEVQGNPKLKGTVIKNIDHRWEYYFDNSEYISLGVFHKSFTNPIEITFVPGVNRIQSFENAKAASSRGLEIESRFQPRNIFNGDLRRFTFISNFTVIQSEIELDSVSQGTQTSRTRPMQGQSPYVINAQLQYDHSPWKLYTGLIYNVIGRRISEVGTNKVPDTYEESFHQLDFVASKSIDRIWQIGFKAKNLLDLDVKETQGSEIVQSRKKGRTFSVNIGVSL